MIATLHPGEEKFFVPPVVLKVYSFTGFELDAPNLTPNKNVEMRFRFSKNKRSWSPWEPLTPANIVATHPDPQVVVYFEVLFKRVGSDMTGTVDIYDLMFTGDFQNVTAAYTRMNRFGFRSDCDYSEVSCQGELSGADAFSDTLNCKGQLFKPYESIKTVRLFDKLANDVNEIFGFEVDYYRVEPDDNGKDVVLHEYGTLHYAEKKVIKVLPPGNKFPNGATQYNPFGGNMMDLFFNVHIVRSEFHTQFGAEFRPSNRDIIHFCRINKLFKVEHAQNTRTFMNAYFYYDVQLVKADNNLSVGKMDEFAELELITKDNSLHSLLGDKVVENTAKVAAKSIMANLSTDKVRSIIKAPIVHAELLNGSNLIATDYYNLTSLGGKQAALYHAVDADVPAGEDRSLTAWFSQQSTKPNAEYNLLTNYDTEGSGYKLSLRNGEVELDWFGTPYALPIVLAERVWYGIVVNLDQRQGTFEYFLYERSMVQEYNHLTLRQHERVPLRQHGATGAFQLSLSGSAMHLTNLRLYKTVLPAEQHLKALSNKNVKDTSKLIFADNANRTVLVPSFKF